MALLIFKKQASRKVVDIAENNLDIPHEHNPFDSSYAESQGQGLDGEIITDKGKIGIECKN